ncbi:HNH endonuclease [Neorhizobium galegae]|uniref:HNH endonuclease n=1 Tax=Neorhizobium galegae TaxID=399 RepID=UPI0006227643|nr:HNH endonuclease [Neorhizobium galegae]KAB1125818.1 HNH endonuclease [Neorhizobium galegae]MCQ1806093.1 HNH endonuclease [Neorhizobium galegae]CDZ55362.1 Protein Ea31 [Neorhizobium galegae bv. orientalis]
MRYLSRPPFDVEAVVQACTNKLENGDLKERLVATQATLTQQEKIYTDHSDSKNWSDFPRSISAGHLTNDEMKSLYKYEMTSEKGAAYRFYSKLKNSSPHGKCPLCGIGVVSSIDHYLPKSRYTDVAITPHNLVPACNDCNKFKHTRFPRLYSEQLLHPYFDDFTEHQWIQGEVYDNGSPVIAFKVDSNGNYSDADEARLHTHFRVLRLAVVYGSNAAEQLTTDRSDLLTTYADSGALGVKKHLDEEAKRYEKKNLNSWQSVYYRTLSASDWFANEGFLGIPE